MLTGQKSLYELFAEYDEERLLQIVTAERAMYRPEALAAAEMVLTHRGVALPTFFTEPEPPSADAAVQGPRKSPYQFIDLCVDVLLVLLVVWGWKRLWAWTDELSGGGPFSTIAYWFMTYGFLCSVYSLRQRWRTKGW